jgi:RND family efflux transporter MFP subunit
MSTEHHSISKPVQALVSILGLILLLVWMQGGFTSKVPPGTARAAEKGEPVRGPTVKAVLKEIDDDMSWPGTVTARTVSQIAPKIPARILAINVKTGDAAKAGQIVARLDPTELQSRVNQAQSALAAAEAQAAKTGADLRRTQSLFDQEAATRQTLEAAQAAAHTAQAQVAEARAAIATTESALSETVLRVPFDGTVLKRNQEPGDMAMPGSPVLTIQSGQHLRVEAAIPESCARDIRLGDSLQARIAENSYNVKVEEITPAADPNTRTVLVKAGLENPSLAKPGVFVWVGQHCGSHTGLLIPSAAVSRSGQLESVLLVMEGSARLRHIRTGKSHDGWVEVLSGLKEGDVVSLGGGK